MSESPVTSRSMTVAVDVMGADSAPEVIIDGAVRAARELQISSRLVGDAQIIEQHLTTLKLAPEISELISIEHAEDFIRMSDSPSKVIRSKKVVSVKRAFELIKKDSACAVVSPGNTGAMLAAGLSVLGTINGITRPAIATLIPRQFSQTPTVLLDSGANVTCQAEQLVQFGILGGHYVQCLYGVKTPKISLLANGSESSKGNDLTKAAAYIFNNLKEHNFTGYVEGRDLCTDTTDVVVCDGFIGNIVLKTLEGGANLFINSIKTEVGKTLRGKLGMLLAKPAFKELFQNKLDPASYGGAPLLGLNGIGIVCHGSSNAKAIFNAIRVAHELAQAGLVGKMTKAIDSAAGAIDSCSYDMSNT